jgi:hypothetical protein
MARTFENTLNKSPSQESDKKAVQVAKKFAGWERSASISDIER